MDTSKEYIKMCEKAEEIQKAHSDELGDYSAGSTSLWIRIGYDESDKSFHYIKLLGSDELNFRKKLWLPRQDQLQEMYRQAVKCSEGKSATWRFVIDIASWLGNKRYPNAFTSMEQLWLAFVMKEKHNKTWDGKNWA